VRILILHSEYLSGAVSGENRVVRDEAELLRANGHHVTVWTPRPSTSTVRGRVRAATTAVWSRRAERAVGSFVSRRSVDVVHVHNLFPSLSPAVLRPTSDRPAATVMTLHNFRMMCLPADLLRDGRPCEDCLGRVPWRGIVHRCYRDSVTASATLAAALTIHRAAGSFDRVTRYLAVSSFVRERHVVAGIPRSRITIKPNFTWPVERRTGPGRYFLFLGRLSHEKGLDTVLRAWARVHSARRLLVVGDGPDREQLRRLAADGVEFLGQVAPDAVPDLLRGARAVLVPSRWYEAAPRTIAEAYAAGVPVIASAIGALPEAVISGTTGRLVPVDDVDAWAAAVDGFGDAESERLGDGALDVWRDRHSPERGLRDLEDAYRLALEAVA
jgi:glycosyltransferase involved in cell wall biosynthesis